MRPKLSTWFRWRKVGAAACTAALIAANACGDDEDTTPGIIGPKGPIDVRIVNVSATAGDAVEPGGELRLACDALVHVRVELHNWMLRPPSACAGFKQCGWIVLRVDPSADGEALLNESAACAEADDDDKSCLSSVISVHTAKLMPVDGLHTFQVELRYGDGVSVQSEGSVLFDEVTVQLLSSPGCAPSDAGSEASDAGEGGEADARDPDATDGADAATPPDAPAEAATDAPPDAQEASDAPDDAA